jgi:glycosyltransferase involved in cell wall biosynthesis
MPEDTAVNPVTHHNGATFKSTRPLRIAQIAPPVETVPPQRYGGIERVIASLTEELVRRGHHVTLFASGDSDTPAELVPTVDRALWHHPIYRDPMPFTAVTLDLVYERAGAFDLIHNHMDFHMFPLARALPGTPAVTTLHGRLDIREYEPLYHRFASLPYVSISDAQRAPLRWLNWIATVHNGVDLSEFPFRPRHEGYLAFLGRVAPEKGLDAAVRIARSAGIPLKIAARMPLDDPKNPEAQRDWCYFEDVIRPLLREPGVEYIGEVGGAEKSAFLGGAAALLFPIQWPEPFGLVMAEALACGTPVLGLRNGSVPEVIEDGVTGYIGDDEEYLVQAALRLDDLDRARCRRAAESRFSSVVMTDRYEEVYHRVLNASALDPIPWQRSTA